jgi:hypothetical protein
VVKLEFEFALLAEFVEFELFATLAEHPAKKTEQIIAAKMRVLFIGSPFKRIKSREHNRGIEVLQAKA